MAGHSQFKNIMFRKGRQDKERSKLFSKLAREITVVGQAGPARPGAQCAAAGRHHRGARRKHAQGQYRARHQEGAGRRRREHRRGALRGLWPRRRGFHHRSADRQPQPHRGRHPLGVLEISAARWAKPIPSPSCSATSGVDRLSAETRAATTRCWRPRSKPAPTNASRPTTATNSSAASKISASVRDALEAKFGAPQSAAIVWRAQNYVAVPDETGETLVKLLDSARRP